MKESIKKGDYLKMYYPYDIYYVRVLEDVYEGDDSCYGVITKIDKASSKALTVGLTCTFSLAGATLISEEEVTKDPFKDLFKALDDYENK